MKILITGAKGQRSHDVVNVPKKRGREALGMDISELNITGKVSVDKVIGTVKPDAVIIVSLGRQLTPPRTRKLCQKPVQ